MKKAAKEDETEDLLLFEAQIELEYFRACSSWTSSM